MLTKKCVCVLPRHRRKRPKGVVFRRCGSCNGIYYEHNTHNAMRICSNTSVGKDNDRTTWYFWHFLHHTKRWWYIILCHPTFCSKLACVCPPRFPRSFPVTFAAPPPSPSDTRYIVPSQSLKDFVDGNMQCNFHTFIRPNQAEQLRKFQQHINGRNPNCGPAIPVKRSNQLSYRGTCSCRALTTSSCTVA